MKNWLGHDIVVGAIVFRGGRQGDSSSFRVGIVDDFDTSKARPARVDWRFDAGTRRIWFGETAWERHPDDYSVMGPHKSSTQRTRYEINDLVRLDNDQLEYLEQRDKLCTLAQHYKIRKEDFTAFEQDFLAGNVPDIN
ncbi:hypothetical protein SEA_DAUBENSKI_124 [Streptomyces phage Daubenski]|uniref:Uncharacterized protein n=1 Tax=Streptomyces phage Daubenski TaxID=2653725 RepID=A0A5Q2WG94_9CAUD|nr:hypothetical protein KNU80_gp152 [Streptomyces phage Daubenski]QGH76420.1 hypothetical protein SEA_DAUBENSKI_124 [Streptomyces phage Daubenski]